MPLLISCQRLLLSGCPCACVSIRACLIILQKFANTISDQLLVRISPNVQINCSWGQRWNHRRSQDFVWGVHFFLPKKLTTFFSRQRPSKYTSKSNPPRKNCPKNWLLLWLGGCTSCPGGALTHFPCKLCPKNFFHRPGGCRCTHCYPLATPMDWTVEMLRSKAFWPQHQQKVKGQGHSETTYGEKATFGISKVMGSNFTVTDSFSGEGIPIDGSPSRTV